MKSASVKKDEGQPLPDSNRESGRGFAVLVAAGIATLVIASLVVLTLGPSWRDNRGLSDGAQSQPETDTQSGQEDGLSLPEGSAARFQAELYGIVDPLVERLPDSTRARCLLASVHQRFAKRAEATRELRQCLALDPSCVEAHYSLGLMSLAVADYPAAERRLRDAFDIDPEWADLSLRLAQAQMSQGDFRAAVLTLDAYLNLDPKDAQAWCDLGQAYQRLDDHLNAKRCHLTAIEVNPDIMDAYYGAAKALRELGEVEESREYFEKFHQMRSSMTVSVRSNKAVLADEDFMRETVISTVTKAGAVYAMNGYLAEAEKCWVRATRLDPTNTDCMETLCRLKPEDPKHWLSLGYLYIQNNRPAEAEGPFQRVIELAPQRADGHAALAEVYIRLGRDTEEAARLARTAVKLEPTAPNYFVLAAARERLEDWAGAESALERAVAIDPANPQYREALAKLQEGRRP